MEHVFFTFNFLNGFLYRVSYPRIVYYYFRPLWSLFLIFLYIAFVHPHIILL